MIGLIFISRIRANSPLLISSICVMAGESEEVSEREKDSEKERMRESEKERISEQENKRER